MLPLITVAACFSLKIKAHAPARVGASFEETVTVLTNGALMAPSPSAITTENCVELPATMLMLLIFNVGMNCSTIVGVAFPLN